MPNSNESTVVQPQENADWLRNRLLQVCDALLKTPQSRRGPFVIEDALIRQVSNTSESFAGA